MSIQFIGSTHEPTRVGRVLFDWWHGLEEDHASRAIVRRAASPTAVALTEPYQRLYRRLLKAGWPADATDGQNERLAAIVGLLAHVKEDIARSSVGSQSISAAMSQRRSDRPLVSELRFRRILESPDCDSLFNALRRVLPLMDYRIDVLQLANDFIYWGDTVRKRWAYDYQWLEEKTT